MTTPAAAPEGRRHRVVVALAALEGFGGLALLHALGLRDEARNVVEALGVSATTYPFADTAAVLTAIDCARRGVVVNVPNACMGGGNYSYSPLLLELRAWSVGPELRVPFGVALGSLFVASLLALPPPRTRGGLGLTVLAAVSTSVLFALERANLDVLMYLLVLAGALLAARASATRAAGYGAIALAASMKFYPAAALILAARERRRVGVALGAAASLAVVAYVATHAASLLRTMRVIPRVHGFGYADMFSARDLFEAWTAAGPFATTPPAAYLALAVPTTLALATGARLAIRDRAALRALDAERRSLLVAGAAVIVACFFGAQNMGYRAIFLLLTLPGWLALAHEPAFLTRPARFGAVALGVVFLLWEQCLHVHVNDLGPLLSAPVVRALRLAFWGLRELVWWWIVARLLAVLLAFLADSPLAPRRIRGG